MIFTILKETDSDVAGDVSYEGCKYKSGQELIGFDGTWDATKELIETNSRVDVNNDLIKSERVEENKSLKSKEKDRGEQFLPILHNRTFYMFSSSV